MDIDTLARTAAMEGVFPTGGVAAICENRKLEIGAVSIRGTGISLTQFDDTSDYARLSAWLARQQPDVIIFPLWAQSCTLADSRTDAGLEGASDEVKEAKAVWKAKATIFQEMAKKMIDDVANYTASDYQQEAMVKACVSAAPAANVASHTFTPQNVP